MSEKRDYTKSIFKVILFAVIAYFGINYYSIITNFIGNILDMFYPFILGGSLAFIINIPMSFLERKFLEEKTKKGKPRFRRKKLARALALILSVLFILSIFFLIIKLIVPELINVFKLLIDKIPYYANEVSFYMENNKENLDLVYDVLSGININQESIKNEIINLAKNVLTSSISLVGSVLGVITDFIISIVFAAYILVSKEKLKGQFKNLFKAYMKPEKYEKTMNVLRVSRNTFSRFITAQCIDAVILGILCTIGMLIFKIPYAIPVGVLIGVTALIPIVGAFIGIIAGVFLILSVEVTKVIPFIIIVLIIQQIEGNLIYPRIEGDSVGLPGLWVLMAVSIGGSLFGIVGMLIGVPLASVIYILLKQGVNQRLTK